MKKLVVLLVGFLLVSLIGLASATTIDFEELSYGQEVSYDLYQSEGILFDPNIDWKIWGSSDYPKALYNDTDWLQDLIASFINPVSSVSVLMGDKTPDTDIGTLVVYDSDGNEITSVDGSGTGWFAVSVDTNNISSFRVISETRVLYDEIIFDGAAAVPEPATMLLFGLGLLGLAGVNRRKQ